jgi:hypothetical protein
MATPPIAIATKTPTTMPAIAPPPIPLECEPVDKLVEEVAVVVEEIGVEFEVVVAAAVVVPATGFCTSKLLRVINNSIKKVSWGYRACETSRSSSPHVDDGLETGLGRATNLGLTCRRI